MNNIEPRDFEKDLADLFGEKMKSSDEFCSEIWSALANTLWKHESFKVSEEEYGCSFRYAGGLIAEIIDWYCSGPYATVSNEIDLAMKAIGWTHREWDILD